MENTSHLPVERVRPEDALFLASSIILGAHRTIRDGQSIVAAILHYAMIGASLTNSLMDLMVSTVPGSNKETNIKESGLP